MHSCVRVGLSLCVQKHWGVVRLVHSPHTRAKPPPYPYVPSPWSASVIMIQGLPVLFGRLQPGLAQRLGIHQIFLLNEQNKTVGPFCTIETTTAATTGTRSSKRSQHTGTLCCCTLKGKFFRPQVPATPSVGHENQFGQPPQAEILFLCPGRSKAPYGMCFMGKYDEPLPEALAGLVGKSKNQETG